MKAYEFALSQPWAITQDALDTILAIAERTNESPEAVAARLGQPLDNSQSAEVIDGVAVVPVEGPIARYMNLFTRISGGTSIDVLARDFRAAIDNPKVKAVVLSFDTPGGTVSGTSEFADHVFAARGGKPVVGYVGGMCCSAGYWMGSACSEVVVDSTAMLGSIGVRAGYTVPAKDGRKVEFVSTDSPDKVPDVTTDKGRSIVQATIDDTYAVFAEAVARNRGVTPEAVRSDFGRGGVFVGAKAVDAGLADRLGSLEGLIAELSRGQWKPPAPRSKPARKAESQPRRAAMSEPNQTAVAGAPSADPVDYKALYEAEARKRAEAQALASANLGELIAAKAAGFATEIIAGSKATHGERATIEAAFAQAAQDDHAHPIAGKPNARQEQVRAIYAGRSEHNLTKTVAASDPANKGRALASDPATDPSVITAEDRDLDDFAAQAQGYGKRLNGSN